MSEKPAITMEKWLEIASSHPRGPEVERLLAGYDSDSIRRVTEQRYGADWGQHLIMHTGDHQAALLVILKREPTYLEVHDSLSGRIVVPATGTTGMATIRRAAEISQAGGGGGGDVQRDEKALASLRAVKSMAAGFQAALSATTGGGAPMRRFREQLITWLGGIVEECDRGISGR